VGGRERRIGLWPFHFTALGERGGGEEGNIQPCWERKEKETLLKRARVQKTPILQEGKKKAKVLRGGGAALGHVLCLIYGIQRIDAKKRGMSRGGERVASAIGCEGERGGMEAPAQKGESRGSRSRRGGKNKPLRDEKGKGLLAGNAREEGGGKREEGDTGAATRLLILLRGKKKERGNYPGGGEKKKKEPAWKGRRFWSLSVVLLMRKGGGGEEQKKKKKKKKKKQVAPLALHFLYSFISRRRRGGKIEKKPTTKNGGGRLIEKKIDEVSASARPCSF